MEKTDRNELQCQMIGPIHSSCSKPTDRRNDYQVFMFYKIIIAYKMIKFYHLRKKTGIGIISKFTLDVDHQLFCKSVQFGYIYNTDDLKV